MLGRLLRSGRSTSRPGAVGVFWDIENCSPPRWVSAAKLVMAIRNLTRPFGPVSFIKLYQDSKSASRQQAGFLDQASRVGMEIRDCPHHGDKEVADRHIMTDVAAFALDHAPPATVVLLSSDHDFAPMLNMLRNRQYNVILVEGRGHTKTALRVAADIVFGFEDVMGRSHILSPVQDPSLPTAAIPPRSLAARCRQYLASLLAPEGAAPKASPMPVSTQHVPSNFRPAPTDQIIFHPLISALTLPQFRRPLVAQMSVARAILVRDPSAFTRAGCSSYSQYFTAAQTAGLVVLGAGPTNAYEWMTLSPALQALVSDFVYADLGDPDDVKRVAAAGYVDLGNPDDVEQIAAAGSSANQPMTAGHGRLPPTKPGAHVIYSSTGAPVWPGPERPSKAQQARWALEKIRRKSAMRAATAAVARLNRSTGYSRSGQIVSPGLAAFLKAQDRPASALDEAAAEDVGTSVPAAVAPANVLPELPSTLPRPPASFTRNPPLEPLPAELFAPLTAILDRPHHQDAVLLTLSRTGEAEQAMARVGAADWREYVARAEVSGVVELGKNGQGRDRWIRLPERSSLEERASVAQVCHTESTADHAAP